MGKPGSGEYLGDAVDAVEIATHGVVDAALRELTEASSPDFMREVWNSAVVGNYLPVIRIATGDAALSVLGEDYG